MALELPKGGARWCKPQGSQSNDSFNDFYQVAAHDSNLFYDLTEWLNALDESSRKGTRWYRRKGSRSNNLFHNFN